MLLLPQKYNSVVASWVFSPFHITCHPMICSFHTYALMNTEILVQSRQSVEEFIESILSRTFCSSCDTLQAFVGLSYFINTINTHMIFRRRPQSFNNCSRNVTGNNFYGQYSALGTFYFHHVKLRVVIVA